MYELGKYHESIGFGDPQRKHAHMQRNVNEVQKQELTKRSKLQSRKWKKKTCERACSISIQIVGSHERTGLVYVAVTIEALNEY